jgi:hypothetical protein
LLAVLPLAAKERLELGRVLGEDVREGLGDEGLRNSLAINKPSHVGKVEVVGSAQLTHDEGRRSRRAGS